MNRGSVLIYGNLELVLKTFSAIIYRKRVDSTWADSLSNLNEIPILIFMLLSSISIYLHPKWL